VFNALPTAQAVQSEASLLPAAATNPAEQSVQVEDAVLSVAPVVSTSAAYH